MNGPLVFTASLVISARLLWTQHDSAQSDLTAVNRSRDAIKKAEMVFQHLDSENSLVINCWKHIHDLSIMCDRRGKSHPNSFH